MAQEQSRKTLEQIAQRSSTPSPNKSTCRNCSKELESFQEHTHGICTACVKEEIRKLRLESIPSILEHDYRIPTHYRSMDWKLSEAIIPCLDTARGLCLVGPVGVGKTTNLCLLARDWLVRWAKEAEISDRDIASYRTQDRLGENSWRFISFPSFVMEIQDAWRREETEDTAYARLKRVANIPRLIVDDLGAEKLTDYVRQATYFLINEREQWDRTTYITSNFPLRDLDRQLDCRISSRIAGMCDIKAFKGDDLRLRKPFEKES